MKRPGVCEYVQLCRRVQTLPQARAENNNVVLGNWSGYSKGGFNLVGTAFTVSSISVFLENLNLNVY